MTGSTKHQTPSSTEIPSTKSQTPTPINREQAKSQIPNPKAATSNRPLGFEIWDLVLGASLLDTHSSFPYTIQKQTSYARPGPSRRRATYPTKRHHGGSLAETNQIHRWQRSLRTVQLLRDDEHPGRLHPRADSRWRAGP